MGESPDSPPSRSPRDHPTTLVEGPGGRRIEFRVLYEDRDLTREVRVLATLGFMKVFLYYAPLDPDHVVTMRELNAVLETAGVAHGANADDLIMMADLVNAAGKPVGPFQVATGTPARAGRDGRIEFLVKPTSHEASYDTDEAGSIDFRKTHRFQNALQDQPVAIVHPPAAGRPGTNILGEPVSAQDGKPTSIRLGSHLRMDKEGVKIYAEDNGRLTWDGRTLSLRTEYVVQGDVDYGEGDIDFVGTVVIHGSVLDDFEVRGARGVTVHGDVGASRIRSDADIRIDGGVAGRGKGLVSAGGAVSVKYLNDVTLEAGGDVTVQREIVNSRVRTQGAVRADAGAIISGETVAFRGVQASTIGSDLGVPTRVGAGIDWQMEEKLAALDRTIADTAARIDRVHGELGPLLENKQNLLGLPSDQKEVLQEVLQELKGMRESLETARADRAACASRTPPGRVSQVNVRTMLYAGAQIRFSHLRSAVKDSARGPLSVIQDMKREIVRVVTHFELIEDDSPDRPSFNRSGDIRRL